MIRKLFSFTKFIVLASLFALNASLSADAQGYRNPIIYADVPDMSICRVGDYYYLISTTMHLMPGAPVMRSSDMQHWETISYVFPRIDDGPRYDLLDHESAYGQGQWASSIRYHNGQFYVWFTANGAPGKGFIYTAKDAAGPWTLLSRPKHMHDGSLFFDDDGKVYVFCETGRLIELNEDLSDQKPGGINKILFERDEEERGALLEGSSVIKHNGKYYLCMISMKWGVPGRVRREVCYRADNILGPYEKKVILETPFERFGGVGQGCIVDGKNGEWYGFIFQDRDGIGRTPCLMPCRWIDDWPILGDENGKIPNDLSVDYTSMEGIAGSDDFNPEGNEKGNLVCHDGKLGLYWQWNHNPIDDAWSLTERPGFLRLKTARIVDQLFLAPNTLTQRMTAPRCSGTVKLDVSKMKDGDVAGLSAFQGDCGALQVMKEGKKMRLVMTEQGMVLRRGSRHLENPKYKEVASVPLKRKQIYLRVDGDFTDGKDMSYYFYSLDGKNWTALGNPVPVKFDYTRMFMGTKFAIFNYATKTLGGYVDVDYFHMESFLR